MASLATPLPVIPRQALAYIRVSTDEQAISVEAQRTLITHWCKPHAVELVVPYPPEQAVIAAARRLRQRGLSHKKIARRLTARGFTSRAGTPFSHAKVRRMLAQAVEEHA
jgi:Resolvase, N terminal domain/Recombinase